ILHSSFFIFHSSFFILHSSFFILHSQSVGTQFIESARSERTTLQAINATEYRPNASKNELLTFNF
ncbi:MAG: hypothetical protein LUC91_07540, partial [Prevotella sp.]|nr:hypothetical protein [Prevotella sp.]